MLEEAAIKPALEVLKTAFGLLRGRLSKRKYNDLMSEVIAELLKESPDLNLILEKLKAAEHSGVAPSRSFFTAQDMLAKEVQHRAKRRGKPKAKRMVKRAVKRKARAKHMVRARARH